MAHTTGELGLMRRVLGSLPGTTSRTGRGVSGAEASLDVLAFAGTVACAYFAKWEARDIIWALWTSSLCVGYTIIVAGAVSGMRGAFRSSRFGSIAMSLFMLGFLTFHFGGFHYGHSCFLNMFFPLIETEKAAPNIFVTLPVVLKSYWPFVGLTLVSRLSDVSAAFGGRLGSGFMASPYANVVRMHMLIFVFAGLHGAGLEGLSLYPVLAAYYFPWGSVFRRRV